MINVIDNSKRASSHSSIRDPCRFVAA